MLGFIISIIAGISMSIQGVFNTRLCEKVGTWQANVFVQGTAFILALLVMLFFRSGNWGELIHINKLYLTGGFIAVIITFTVMEGIKLVGLTTSISTILISQLLAAALIDLLGLFGTDSIKFEWSKLIGLIVMISGLIIFKIKG